MPLQRLHRLQQPPPQRLAPLREPALRPRVLGPALGRLDPHGRVVAAGQVGHAGEVVRRGPHVQGPDVPREVEAVRHDLRAHPRHELVRPLVEVHARVQASRLLHVPHALPRGERTVVALVEPSRLGREEAEGVEVRAPDPLGLDHRVRPRRAQAQRQLGVAHAVHVRAVRHGPLVQSEAPQPGRSSGGPGEKVAREGDAGRPVAREGRLVHGPARGRRRRPARRERLSRAHAAHVLPRPSGRGAGLLGLSGGVRPGVVVGEEHARPGMPARQRRGGVGVVAEQEVLHGMLLAAHVQRHQRRGPRGDPLPVRAGARPPLLGGEHDDGGARVPGRRGDRSGRVGLDLEHGASILPRRASLPVPTTSTRPPAGPCPAPGGPSVSLLGGVPLWFSSSRESD